MRNYLKELKPTNIEDLIAMNALYRPGPMEYIPTYIKRKHGREQVIYPHPKLEDILKPTYGIMVYQEQIMQTAQILAGFSLGKADVLRRAMGKKDMKIMSEMKPAFITGAKENHVDESKSEEVFQVMQEFAKYGFNRSHSAAYSVIAYQTAYLKANYPAEYMAAVLTHNLSDIKKITFFIDESKRQGIPVLGPDINESGMNFMVNEKGEIRFGLAAIKNVGENAALSVIEERTSNGTYKSIFDFVKRVNLRSVNRRSLESLAMAGAFDCFDETHRAQFFYRENTEDTIFLEKIIKHATDFQQQLSSSQVSLFGEYTSVEIKDPLLPQCSPWSKMEQLKNEKEVTGFYMSGHPLEDFSGEIESFCNININELKNNKENHQNKNLIFAGILTSVNHRTSKTGNVFATFTLEDFTDSDNFILFSEDYLKMKHFLLEGSSLLITARIMSRNSKNRDQLDVRINNIMLLSEAYEKKTKEINMYIRLTDIKDELVNMLTEIIRKSDGNCRLKLQVTDDENNNSIEMPLQKQTVNPLNLMREISQIPVIKTKITF
jgi:DNA polymerase-3 subunit alpha